MPHILTGETKFTCCIQDIPCAAFTVRNDENLTLIEGNQAFFDLLECTSEDVRLRYGGRLAALLDAEPIRMLHITNDTVLGPVTLRQRITKGNTERWIKTTLNASPSEGCAILTCVAYDITEYEDQTRALHSMNETIQLAARQSGLDYFDYDFKTKNALLLCAPSILTGITLDDRSVCHDFTGQLISSGIIRPGVVSAFEEVFSNLCSGREERSVCEIGIELPAGLKWVRLTLTLKKNRDHAIGILEDITQEREAVRNYLNETQFYQALLSEKAAYGQVDVNEDRLTRVGGMWNLYNEIIGTVSYSHLIDEFINKVVHPDDRKHYLEVMQTSNFLQSFESGIDQVGCEFRRIVDQNKMMWMELRVHLFRDPLTSHLLALLTIENIDAKKKQQLLLLHDSRIDELTNIYNRRMAENQIRNYLMTLTEDEVCAFAILDIDNFKAINETEGHAAGDQVLVHLSDTLSRTFRRSDIIGRYGGDEFIIFLKSIGTQAEAAKRLDSLYRRISEDTTLSKVQCSAGIAVAKGYHTYEEFFSQADQALYHGKRSGKNRFVFYDGSWDLSDLTLPERNVPSITDMTDSTDISSVLFSSENNQNFDSFIGEQGDLAYLIDPNTFDLICGNQAFYDRLGVSETQCRGMKCYEAMHKRSSPCPFCSKANWSTDKFYLWRNLNMALEQEFLIKNKLVTWQGKTALLAIAVDISNDKSIVDSMENGATETHGILSGVQRMTDAPTLSAAMESAMETIGSFFRSDSVHFWTTDSEQGCMCVYQWNKKQKGVLLSKDCQIIGKWLETCIWDQPVIIDNPEAMLRYSYDMYSCMIRNHVYNARFIQLKEKEEVLGYISIENISSNFQNLAFLDSFRTFLIGEFHKRSLIENALYAELHDDLTDLLSRKSFENYIEKFNPDDLACLGVLMSNFNNLKGINSMRGFQVGNYYINQFADMLRKVFVNELIFRMNGDEFLVILPEVTRSALESKVEELEMLIEANGAFTVSVGQAWDDVENNLSLLIDQATQSMKAHKRRFYDSTPDTINVERRKMLSELVTSIENKEFEVFLQPKVELLHGTVVGAEALIRYHHPVLGYIPPSKFIDMLEKNNLIRYIDLFVFEEVCRLLEKWSRQGLFLPVISLNFSRLTLLEKDILNSMEAIISNYDISRKYIEIEITESIASMGKSVLYQASYDLYKAGFSISLDDFGTKYTNLAILADINFSMLKVDRSLVGELKTGANHRVIVKNIVSMCQDLGIDVLAEGIETEDQERILRNMECRLGQGYLYGKPMPIEEFNRKYIEINLIK